MSAPPFNTSHSHSEKELSNSDDTDNLINDVDTNDDSISLGNKKKKKKNDNNKTEEDLLHKLLSAAQHKRQQSPQPPSCDVTLRMQPSWMSLCVKKETPWACGVGHGTRCL